MREQLIHYVDLLFAGASDANDIKQEILQNTLDRYDDLIDHGKSPEAAYRLAISGIGDINEILGSEDAASTFAEGPAASESNQKNPEKKQLRAAAIAMYIACPIPLFILGDEIGLSLLLLLVAAATALLILAGKDSHTANSADTHREEARYREYSPRNELRRSIRSIVWVAGFAVYLIVSLITHAWYITWLVFPITACVAGLINACVDLREGE